MGICRRRVLLRQYLSIPPDLCIVPSTDSSYVFLLRVRCHRLGGDNRGSFRSGGMITGWQDLESFILEDCSVP